MAVLTPIHGALKRCWHGRGERALGVFALATVGLATLTLLPGPTRATKNLLGRSGVLGKINEHLNPFRSRAALLNCGLPVYDLHVSPREYRRVLEIADEALQRDYMTPDLKRWVKAEFIHEGKTTDVKVRLRGNNPSHWANERKSWRIRFPESAPFNGQREINLIIPTDNKGIHQAFVLAVYRKLGSITQRDGYCVLRLNGVPQGVYYQIEHIDGPLLAYNRRPESTVFTNPKEAGGGALELGCFKEQITANADEAWQALQALLDYESEPTQRNLEAALAVTDVEDFLRYTAGTTLFCSDHNSLVTDNHKLYYDSSRGLFYRIPWDCAPNHIPGVQRFDMADWRATFDVFARWPMSKLRVAVLRDKPFRLRRDRILWELVADDSLLDLFDETYAGLDMAFWADVMGRGDDEARIGAFRDIVKTNVRTIRGILSNGQSVLRVRDENGERLSLQFAVHNAAGMVVAQIRIASDAPGVTHALVRDAGDDGRLDVNDPLVARAVSDKSGAVIFGNLADLMLPDTGLAEYFPAYLYQEENGIGSYKTKPLRSVVFPKTARYGYFITRESAGTAASNVRPEISVEAYNAVTDSRLADADLNIRSYFANRGFAPQERFAGVAEFLESHTEFRAGPAVGDGKSAVLSRGVHYLDGTTVLPEGVTLVIEAGAELRMGSGASLVAHGPVIAAASEKSPIRITRAGDAPWGTIAAVRAGGQSVFRHVELSGGRGGTVNGITLTGALAVHDGDVTIAHCWIHDCPAEDAVNVKNGFAHVSACRFANNSSDGIDLDFVRGEVTACHFNKTGDDAIDVSGSTVTITRNRIERAGDKGISVGEESHVDISENLLLDGTYGVAVKDRSTARIDHCTFLGNRSSVAAYCKKPIFGGGNAHVTNCIILDSIEPLLSDELSTLELRECVLPMHFVRSGCTNAPAEVANNLRRHGFVLDADTGASSGRLVNQSARPAGITYAPVDLR